MLRSQQKLPSATPGVGECTICFEVVPCVKVLDCFHSLCGSCAEKLAKKSQTQNQTDSSSEFTICCPLCRNLTDVSDGIQFLATKYFGKVKCDLCLSQKETEDVWWCNQCAQSICSKCTIKEHSTKNHTISEWNKLDPINYSIKYINGVRLSREKSANTDKNKLAVRSFLGQVEEALQRQLASPPDLEELRTKLLHYYGRGFCRQASESVSRQPSGQCTPLVPLMPSAPPALQLKQNRSEADLVSPQKRRHQSTESIGSTDSGPKVIAKVLQLAGSNIREALIPNIGERLFHVRFAITPDEVASYLVSKIQFIPSEEDDEDEEGSEGELDLSNMLNFDARSAGQRFRAEQSPSKCESSTSTTTTTGRRELASSHQPPPTKAKQIQAAAASKANEATCIYDALEEHQIAKPKISNILQMDISANDILVLRSDVEIVVCNLITKAQYTVNAAPDIIYRDISIQTKSDTLLVVTQSLNRKHEWFLEAWDISPSSIRHAKLYQSELDIDPDDKVLSVHMATAASTQTIYEIRNCEKHASEILRVTITDRKSRGSMKLKEVLLHQKPGCKFTQVCAMDYNGKESHLIVWESLTKSLMKLTIRNCKCEAAVKLWIGTDVALPYCLDETGFLWIMDSSDKVLKASKTPVFSKMATGFTPIVKYAKYPITALRYNDLRSRIISLSIMPNSLVLTTFGKR